MAGLKVMMMGGSRVGKSSALAAIMEAFINGCGKEFFTAKDVTVSAETSIASRLADVKKMLRENVGRTIMVDSGSTNHQCDYQLQLQLAGSDRSMEITFTDLNGEFFRTGDSRQEKTLELLREYDVFIVAVDTTYLMEARNGSKFVRKSVHTRYNCVESIQTYLSEVEDDGGKNAKLVIFVPIKCEYWARNNQLDAVTKAVEEDYKTTIINLRKMDVQIEILPVQTIGSVVFAEHLEARLFNWSRRWFFFFKESVVSRCSVLPDGRVRLSDGTLKNVSDGELSDDPASVLIAGSDMVRPNTWFRVESEVYRPHNCEQIAYHILKFMLSKAVDADSRKHPLLKGLKLVRDFTLNVATLGLWGYVFGDIPIETMKEVLERIERRGLIKETGEGIKILKTNSFMS